MKTEADMKTLALDGRHQITLDLGRTLYVVKQGTVILHFAELDAQGVNKRKHFVAVYRTGQSFSGCLHRQDGKRYALIASGEKDTEVHELDLEHLGPETDPELRHDMLQRVNMFFAGSIGDGAEIPVLESLSGPLIESNNALVIGNLKNRIERKEILEREDISSRQRMNDSYSAKSLRYILGIFGKKTGAAVCAETGREDVLYTACSVLCRRLGISIVSWSQIQKCVDGDPAIEDIARISKFAVRDVILEDSWWKTDNGPLLLSAMEDERPLVCLPVSPNRYTLIDFKDGSEKILTRENAGALIPRGTMFYRPFPDKKLTYRDVFLFGVAASWKRDIVKLLLATFIASLVGLLLPELNKRIYDDYIPEGDGMQLFQAGMLMLSFMVGNFFVSLTKSFCTFRATNMMEYGIQAATFDRLFNLPGRFYGDFTSGNLASRAMGITAIFNSLADIVVSTFLSSIFSFLYLWRMFHYSKQLSWPGIVMVAITISLTIGVGLMQLKFQKKLLEISNRLSGFMYQLLLGIPKLRTSGSEDRAVYKWNGFFLKTRKLIVDKEKISNIVGALDNMLTTLFTVVIYYILIVKKIEINFGSFMAYTSAFGSFSAVMLDMSRTFLKAVNLGPIYDKAKPVLEARTEYCENLEFVGPLTGGIEVSGVNFKYSPDGPAILKNVNISIKPGEYIGIVGPSGGGKSTLLKILLGFENADTGKVFYDDKDLDLVDKRELRKKLGVVLQDGHLVSGSIYENITITNSRISMRSVREVVKEAGLEDDIAKMPMGLYTNLMEDAGTISGGQKQRILIARAIVNRPKILFFDEATSSLDNITQSIVCESLRRLNATRVVIAHRLSTIIDCDRILVIADGQIVEEGTYADLMEHKALFHELVRRQIN